MSCCNDHRYSGQAEAFDEAAATFEVFANDIDAMLRRGMYRGKIKTIEEARRDEQRRLAGELREYASEARSKLER